MLSSHDNEWNQKGIYPQTLNGICNTHMKDEQEKSKSKIVYAGREIAYGIIKFNIGQMERE